MIEAAVALAVGAVAAEGVRQGRGFLTRRERRKIEHALAALPPVRLSEIVPYRLPGHAKCGGTGLVRGAVIVACDCAQKRFIAANKNKIRKFRGAVVWASGAGQAP